MVNKAADRNQDRISWALGAAAVLLGGLALVQIAGFCVQCGRARGTALPAHRERDLNSLKRCLGEAKQVAEALKKDNLFVKAPPKEPPVKQVEGILGSEAFIGGKWYKVGDTIADAKIVAIAATQVEIEWDGKKTSFSPMASGGAGPPVPPGARDPRKDAGSPPSRPTEAKVVRTDGAANRLEDPFAWVGVKLSPKAQARLGEMWNKASPEQREKMKQDWNNLSDEQKQQHVEMVERSL